MLILILAIIACVFGAGVAYRRPRHFPLFLLSTGTLRFGVDDAVGGTNLSALWLMWLLVLSGVALYRLPRRTGTLSFPEKLYALFLAWCVFEAMRAPSLAFAARLLLKMLFPFAVMVLARRAYLDQWDVQEGLARVLKISFCVCLLVGGYTQRFLPPLCWAASDVFWHAAAFADHASLMGALSLIFWRASRKSRYLALGVFFGLSSIFAGIRTGIAAFGVGVSCFVLFGFRRHVAIPLLLGVYVVTAASLFLIPSVREHMFFNARKVAASELIVRPDRLSTDQVDSSGRFEMWDVVLRRFFDPNPLLGSGLGTTQAWFYSGAYGRARVEHSSYVRLLADTGLIGFLLYCGTMLSCMGVAWRCLRRSPPGTVRIVAMFVLCGFPAVMVCMAFDNVLNYALAVGQYPFALTGLMLALAGKPAVCRGAADAGLTSLPRGGFETPVPEGAPGL
ncbi:MAG: O-antigen ligase family protein [Phycisphaerae bacterium]|nr:O-antigen ligase family protein [Phycisphaerae bacterium]